MPPSQKMLSNYSTFLAAGSGSAFNPCSFHLLNQTYLTWVGWLLAHIKRTSASYSQAVDETSQAANGFQVEIVSTHRWVDLPERKQMHCKHPVSISSYRTPKKTLLHCYPHPISRISLHNLCNKNCHRGLFIEQSTSRPTLLRKRQDLTRSRYACPDDHFCRAQQKVGLSKGRLVSPLTDEVLKLIGGTVCGVVEK